MWLQTVERYCIVSCRVSDITAGIKECKARRREQRLLNVVYTTSHEHTHSVHQVKGMQFCLPLLGIQQTAPTMSSMFLVSVGTTRCHCHQNALISVTVRSRVNHANTDELLHFHHETVLSVPLMSLPVFVVCLY